MMIGQQCMGGADSLVQSAALSIHIKLVPFIEVLVGMLAVPYGTAVHVFFKKNVETILDFCKPDQSLIKEVCLALESQYPVSKHSLALAMKMEYKAANGGSDSDDSGIDTDSDSDEDKERKKVARKPQKKKPRKRRASLVERQSQVTK